MTNPTALWGSLVKSGYQVVYAVTIEGIPYCAGERELWTTRGLAATAPSGYTFSAALVLQEGVRFGQACNREEGLASGRAVDIAFGRQQLADEGLGAALFARPTKRATLATPVTDPAEDEFVVDDSSAWSSTGFFYIGREYVTFTGNTSGSFTGCTRGVAGYPHYHTASTASAYRQCTDTPVYWRGRLVTVWEHLVSPEGRFLGTEWATLGEFCRQTWRGYVRDTPRPEQAGMVLTCLPLVRLGAQEFGAEISGKMRPDWIVSDPGDVVVLSHPNPGIETFPSSPITTNNGIISLQTWAAIAENHAKADWSADFFWRPRALHIKIPFNDGNDGDAILVDSQAWFLDSTGISARRYQLNSSGSAGYEYILPLTFIPAGGGQAGAWIVVELEPNVDYSDALVGETGLLALDVGGHIEIVSYDDTRASSDGTKRAFRLSAREVLGTTSNGADGYANPWLNDTTVRVIAGARGLWGEALHTLLTSSGTGSEASPGARGPYDKLPFGFGLALPDDWIAAGTPTSAFTVVQQAFRTELSAVTTGKTSIKELLCGWLALVGACLVQRRQDDGAIVFDVVITTPQDDPNAMELSASDVLLDGHETPELIEAPNHIKITTGDLLNERPLYVIRDAARAQNEGVRSLEIKAPSMGSDQALLYGGEMMQMGDGQAAVKMRLPPWVEIQIGDSIEDTTAHPAVWDWSTGTYAPESVQGQVVEHERDSWTQTQDITVLLAGQSQEGVFLCPSAVVTTAVSPTEYRVAPGDSLGFSVGMYVMFYEVGNEDLNYGFATILTVVEGATYDTITVDVDPGAAGTEMVITYPEAGDANAKQLRYMYVQDGKVWR